MGKLNDKQSDFTYTMGRFLVWCHENGYECIGTEWYRTKEQAEIYKQKGIGILNSVHRKKLAVDIFRYKDQRITWDQSDYFDMGQKWKSMHPLARWGGDFRNRDCVHFSFEHGGVK